jgi:hypothetical protein
MGVIDNTLRFIIHPKALLPGTIGKVPILIIKRRVYLVEAAQMHKLLPVEKPTSS